MLGDRARVRKFTVSMLRVANGKCLHRFASDFRHESSNGAGIDAAAQKDAQGNITHQVTVDSAFQQVTVALDVVSLLLRFIEGPNIAGRGSLPGYSLPGCGPASAFGFRHKTFPRSTNNRGPETQAAHSD